MSNARILLAALICASPALVLVDGPIVHGVLAGTLAAGILIMVRAMRPGELDFLSSLVWPVAAMAAVPALWMLLQVLPLRPLAHPIWSSAEGALGHPIAGSISIDTGASVLALGQYLAAGAIMLLGAAISVDRQRAEGVLLALVTGTALIALMLAVNDLFGLTWLKGESGFLPRAQAVDCCALGMIVSAGAGVRAFERLDLRQPSRAQSAPKPAQSLAACGGTLAICTMALVFSANANVLIAAGFGVATVAGTMIIRRLALGFWGIATIAVSMICLAMVLAAGVPNLRAKGLSVAFAVDLPPPLETMSRRMLADAPVIGTGAGTFAALAPIYREADDPQEYLVPPTAAAALTVELGRPMFWLIVAAALGLFVALLRAALRRGRDSFYPAAGAGCVISLLLLSFMNAGLLGAAVATNGAAILGMALAQSKSRTLQPY